MTYKEYWNIDKDTFKELYGYNKYHYKGIMHRYYKELIDAMKLARPGMNIVLHHYWKGDKHYELWNTIPMYVDDHSRMHNTNIFKGKKHTEQSRRNMSLAHKGKRLSPEAQKIASAKRIATRKAKGFTLSAEARAKIGAKNKILRTGVKQSPEVVKAKSEKLKGRKNTPEQIKKQLANLRTPEVSKKISEGVKRACARRKLLNSEVNHGNRME